MSRRRREAQRREKVMFESLPAKNMTLKTGINALVDVIKQHKYALARELSR